jgi:anti-anti-sigma regulatory factor
MSLRPDATMDIVKLPAHCTTTASADLHASLLAGALTLDASDVESVGQAVLQLLVAARVEAGDGFAIIDPSPAFVDRITACGLTEAVGLIIEEESVQ